MTYIRLIFHYLNLKSDLKTVKLGLTKKKPYIPITLPTLNYPATLFHIFIFMQIYANFYLIMLIYANFYFIMLIYAQNILIMQIYEHFVNIFMKFFDKAKTPCLNVK